LTLPGSKASALWTEAKASFPEDPEQAEQSQGVRVTQGDALLIRTGWYQRRVENGPYHEQPSRPGLHAALPWLHERGVAVVASDASHDCTPSGYPFGPIHSVVVAMGLCLFDACQFEDLKAACEADNRWEFMLVVAPWRWRGATYSPATNIAIL
jgi:kynurenine formamidase